MKKLLPLLSICSTAAIVAPIVTSCSHDINVIMEWYEQTPDATGYFVQEHLIEGKKLYKVNIDLIKAKWRLDYTTTAFNFIFSAKSKEGRTQNQISAPDVQNIYLNGNLKTNWVLEAKDTGQVMFSTEKGEITQNSKIDVEIMYDNVEDFETFTADFQFNVSNRF